MNPDAPEVLNDHEILDIALANGFKLKEQPDGSFSLHPSVWQFAKSIEQRTIQVRQSQIDVLKEALKPFAAFAAHYPTERKYGNRPAAGEWCNVESGGLGRAQIDVEDFHRAAELLKVKP